LILDLSGSDEKEDKDFNDCEDIGSDAEVSINMSRQVNAPNIQKKNVFENFNNADAPLGNGH
jgi:hypothetical protein